MPLQDQEPRDVRRVGASLLIALVLTAAIVPPGMAQTAPAACSTPTFGAPVLYTTGSVPGPVFAADFSRDGRTDFVVVNVFDQSVSAFLGRGDGTFRAPRNSFANIADTAAATGDFNADGRTDLVLMNPEGPFLETLLGNADGTFHLLPASTLPLLNPGAAQNLAVGDFDRDGAQDVVIPESSTSLPTAPNLVLARGRGDGTFAPPVPLSVGPFARSVATADLDHDGRLDLVFSTFDGVSVLIGHGDGTFDLASTTPVPNVGFVALRDLNGDGQPELLTTTNNAVMVACGLNNGSFGPLTSYAAPAVAVSSSLVVADFNLDGRPDVATNGASRPPLSVLFGNGDGQLEPVVEVPLPATPLRQGGPSVAAADFNGDGLADLVTTLTLTEAPDFTLFSRAAVVFNTCGLGTSLGLNGTTGFASVPHSSDLNLTRAWTVETWFRDDSPSGFDHDYVTLVHKGDRQVSAEAPLVVSLGYKQILVGIRSDWIDYALNYPLAPGVVDPGQWHHLAASFDSNSRAIKLYVDGSLATQGQLGATSVGNTLPLQIGRNGPESGRYFNGKLDDVRIWNTVRSASQIRANYRRPLVNTPPALIGNWRFDDSGADSAGEHDATVFASFSHDVHP